SNSPRLRRRRSASAASDRCPGTPAARDRVGSAVAHPFVPASVIARSRIACRLLLAPKDKAAQPCESTHWSERPYLRGLLSSPRSHPRGEVRPTIGLMAGSGFPALAGRAELVYFMGTFATSLPVFRSNVCPGFAASTVATI